MDDIENQAILLERQLSVLSDTYPGWMISLTPDGWFVAQWLRPLTEAQRSRGVIGALGRRDPISLAAALSRQQGLISETRSR